MRNGDANFGWQWDFLFHGDKNFGDFGNDENKNKNHHGETGTGHDDGVHEAGENFIF